MKEKQGQAWVIAVRRDSQLVLYSLCPYQLSMCAFRLFIHLQDSIGSYNTQILILSVSTSQETENILSQI